MERWIHGFKVVLDIMLKHPDTAVERLVLLSIPFFFCIIVLCKTGKLLGISKASRGRSFIVSLVGLILNLLAMTAVYLYFPESGALLWVAAAIAVSLILVVPLMCLLQKAKYSSALVTWVISLGALAGMILIVSAVFDAVASGAQKADKSKIRRQEIEQLYENDK